MCLKIIIHFYPQAHAQSRAPSFVTALIFSIDYNKFNAIRVCQTAFPHCKIRMNISTVKVEKAVFSVHFRITHQFINLFNFALNKAPNIVSSLKCNYIIISIIIIIISIINIYYLYYYYYHHR